jgi:hypothetical protein
MKVSELMGAALDQWVARAEGHCVKPRFRAEANAEVMVIIDGHVTRGVPHYSTNWGEGGPIIEKAAIGWRSASGEGIHVGAHKGLSSVDGQPWEAWFCDDGPEGGNVVHQHVQTGRTMLEACMRAYVASKYGEEVPEE